MRHMKKIIIFILIFFTALSITSCGIAIVNDDFVITDGDNNKGISIEDDDSDDDTIVDNNENEVDDTKTINNEIIRDEHLIAFFKKYSFLLRPIELRNNFYNKYK